MNLHNWREGLHIFHRNFLWLLTLVVVHTVVLGVLFFVLGPVLWLVEQFVGERSVAFLRAYRAIGGIGVLLFAEPLIFFWGVAAVGRVPRGAKALASRRRSAPEFAARLGMSAATSIRYSKDATITVEAFIDILERSTLSERRPVEDRGLCAGDARERRPARHRLASRPARGCCALGDGLPLLLLPVGSRGGCCAATRRCRT